MDNRLTHLSPYPRSFTLLPYVETVGFLRRKTNRVVRVFSTCNLSFILAGRGTYLYRGVMFPVEAPCVLLQWPGEPMNYGPYEGSEWTELFLIYPEDCLDVLQRSGAFTPGDTPVRAVPVELSDAVTRLEDRLDAQLIDADGIDVMCWDLIVSSFGAGFVADGRLSVVDRCQNHLRQNLVGAFDISELAVSVGMSLSSLRRCWAAVHGRHTFSDYRDMILLQRSCRLLVETQASVKEIASRVGFSDPYYFSRRFRQLAGCTPTDYRRTRAVHR